MRPRFSKYYPETIPLPRKNHYNYAMGKITKHNYPNQTLYKMQQIGLGILFASAVFGAIALAVFAFLLGFPLFVIMALLVLGLSGYVLMGIVNTPPIIIRDDGITLQAMFDKDRHIAWDEIDTIAPYPLLPQANQEILKQYLVGRNKYQSADGIMLLIPSLPFPYRIAGALAGEKGVPMIAFTNRTHTDYETLVARIQGTIPHAIRQDAPLDEESL